MFLADFILSKNETLAKIWIAAHWENRLSKSVVLKINIFETVAAILNADQIVAVRTSGHLLLGVVKIYSKKAVFLLNDCHEALTFILNKSRSDSKRKLLFSPNSTFDSSSATIERTRGRGGHSKKKNFSNNISKVEDITILNQLHDDLYGSSFLSVEAMRNAPDRSSNISDLEVARSFGNLNDSKLLQNDHPMDFSNINFANFDDDQHIFDAPSLSSFGIKNPSFNATPRNDSILHQYTLGSLELTNNENGSALLDENILPEIRSFNSAKTYSKRKRKLQVDKTNILGNLPLDNYQGSYSINRNAHIQSKSSQLMTCGLQKENIPPAYASENINMVSFLTFHDSRMMSRFPLLQHCEKKINTERVNIPVYNEVNYDKPINEELTRYELDSNIPYDDTNDIDTFFGAQENDVTNIDHCIPGMNDSMNDYDKTLDSFNKSLEKYDDENNYWSKSTVKVAQDLNKMTMENRKISFESFLKQTKVNSRKSVTRNFYSLLILQKENVFKMRQLVSFDSIELSRTRYTSKVVPRTPPTFIQDVVIDR